MTTTNSLKQHDQLKHDRHNEMTQQLQQQSQTTQPAKARSPE